MQVTPSASIRRKRSVVRLIILYEQHCTTSGSFSLNTRESAVFKHAVTLLGFSSYRLGPVAYAKIRDFVLTT